MGYSEIKNMLQQMPGGCAVIRGGEVWEVISANDEFYKPGGYTESEIHEMPNDIYDIVYKADMAELRKIADEALHSGEMREGEFRIYDKQGKIHWLATKMKFYCYKDREPCYFVSIWDIHKRKQIEQELCLQSERYKQLEEINNEIPFEYDVREQIFLVTKRSKLFRKSEREKKRIIHRNEIKKLLHPEDVEKICKVIDEASMKTEEGTVEYRIRFNEEEKGTEWKWYRSIYKSIMGVNGKVVRVLGRTEDITEQKLKQYEMAQQLKCDSLTGLLNRAAAQTIIEEFLRANPEGEHAFFLIDVDNFKTVNDTFGHLFGDSVLVNIAEKITGMFRSSDIIGRVGGDEFIAFMKYTGQEQARMKAQSICEIVRQQYDSEGETIEISCSVGIAFADEERSDYTTLFSKADMAMYRAKKAGKNQYSVAEYLDPEWRIQNKGIESRNSQYRAGKAQDFDFLTKAFLLLSHAKDVNNSLNVLIERIGRQYDLGAVVIFERNTQKKEVWRTNSWSRENGILPKKKVPEEGSNFKWKCFCNKMEKEEMICINDCQKDTSITREEQEIFRERGMCAMIGGKFSYLERGRGYVMFCDMKKRRSWSEFEQEIFKELIRLFSVFVAVRCQQEEEQYTIRKLKKRDALTGLYNEEAFKEKVYEIKKNPDKTMQYAVVYTDINDFSYINDNYGQEAGNGILKRFAAVVRENPNSIGCRLYSDLFISFMWGRDKESILQYVIEKNTSFSSQHKQRYIAENVKLSTGIYFLESPDEDLEIAIENANLTRKSIKGNDSIFCRVYEKKLRQQREKEKKVIEEFPKALENKQFLVYVQPQFQLDKRSFVGGEALIRWKNPKGKIECPDDFIPALEKSGDIIELDFYVYEQILKAMKRWQDAGKTLPVISVNFSRRHFEAGGIYRKVVERANAYEIPPSCIEIEITESLFTSGYEMVKLEMEKLRSAGFQVAIDDFGTGYSSLSMLMDIPVDVVKIDKSFLSRENSKRGRQFIENMGRLIHDAKENVIVEGIETEEQYNFLTKCGFEYGQGFLFEQPLSLSVFEEKYIK